MALSRVVNIVRRIRRRLRPVYGSSSYPIRLYPRTKPIRGQVLFSYLADPLCWPVESTGFDGHSNSWRSREIASIFSNLGYVVDAINWDDKSFVPVVHYDIIFDICYNLGRLEQQLGGTIKILYCTGSDPYYQNSAELQRVEAANQRRNGQYTPKRMIADPELARYSMQIADICALTGNENTLSTYPEVFWDKMHLVTGVASSLGNTLKSKDEYVPVQREFLWFFGGGAVHKGLDLVLEVFAKNPHLVLNVVGDVAGEADFLQMYESELMRLPNIHYHGYLNPNSESFREIIRNVFCFIAPSCSEGTSSAVITCLQIGMYPIISRDTGVSLPAGCGIYLHDCTIEEIEQAALSVYDKPSSTLSSEIAITQTYALQRFSRPAFHEELQQFIIEAISSR